MKVECKECGRIDELYWMHAISTGRKTEYYCEKCYRHGQDQAKAAEGTKYSRHASAKPANR